MLHLFLLIQVERTRRVDTKAERTSQTITIVVCQSTCTRVDIRLAICIAQEHRIDSRNSIDVVETVVHRTITLLVRRVHIAVWISDIQVTLEPFLRRKIEVTTQCNTAIIRWLIVTLILQITDTGEVIHLLCTTMKLHGSIVFLSHAEDLVAPWLEILITLATWDIHIKRRIHLAIRIIRVHQELTLGIPQVVSYWQTRVAIECLACVLNSSCFTLTAHMAERVVQTHPRHSHIFLWTCHHIVQWQQTHVGTILHVHIYLAFLVGVTLFGCDHYHTIRTAATIQCCSCCIFQNGCRSNITWIDRRDVTVVGHTIYHVQWRLTTTQGAHTTNYQCSIGTWLTRRVDNLYTCHLTGQGLWHLSWALLLNHLSIYTLSWTCETTLRHVAITRYDNLLNHLGSFVQYHRHALFDGYLLRLHTHKTYNQGSSIIRYGQNELTVVVRNGTQWCALHGDTSTYHGLIVRV